MNYYLKQGAQEAYLKVGSLISDAGATAQIFEITDNPQLVLKKFRDPAEARAMEPKITQMVKNLPSEDLKEIGAGSLTIHSLAWPTHCVYAKGEFAGFLMPYIDHKSSISLNKIFSVKSREKNGITEDLRWRIYVARNLVAVYNTLHKAGYYVIDTKPANIRTYKDSPAVSILDCDGFRHTSDSSATGFITEEYIAPSSIGKPFSELGGEQDLFAVSILVFQILNNGIHPFQGVQGASTAYTTQELIEKKAYPYGESPTLVLKPSPISCHSLFPDPLKEHFDKVFSGKSRAKSVQGLLDILDDLKQGRGLTSCINPSHYAFSKGCPSCFLNDFRNAKATQPKLPPQQSLKIPIPSQPWNPTNPAKPKSSSGLGWLLFGGIIGFGLLIGGLEQSKKTTRVVSAPAPSYTPPASSSKTSTNAALSNEDVCARATGTDENNIRWTNDSYRDLARSRALTCGVPSEYNYDSLCRMATRGGQWETRVKYLQYVRYAKSKGFRCGVQALASNQQKSSNKIVPMTLESSWWVTKSNGKCVAVGDYVDGSRLIFRRTSSGNYNATYQLDVALKDYFSAIRQNIMFKPNNSAGERYSYAADIDPDSSYIEFKSDFAKKLRRADNLSIYSDKKQVEYRFALNGSASAIDRVTKGECN